MLLDDANPFTKMFIVDVTVETVKGKPALYRILDVLEIMDMPSEDANLLG